MILAACIPWESVRLQITAWAPPVLLILGVITLVITLRTWRERRRTIDLQVARRARKVLRSLDEWLKQPSLVTATTLPSSEQTNQLAIWVKHVMKGENEVQELLEQMLDAAGGASRDVQQAAQGTYSEFLRASDLIHKFGSGVHITPQTSHLEQAEAAKAHLENVRGAVLRIIPEDLL